MEIRSYRAVFDLERRLYRIDRLRLNPGGVPLRGVVYGLALLAAVALLAALPLLGAVVRILPWYLRDLALPGGGAALLTMIRLEGRPFHLAGAALVRYAFSHRCLAGLRPCSPPGRRWHPGTLLLLPDGSASRPRRLRYTGPGAVRVVATREVFVLERGTELQASRAPDRRPGVQAGHGSAASSLPGWRRARPVGARGHRDSPDRLDGAEAEA